MKANLSKRLKFFILILSVSAAMLSACSAFPQKETVPSATESSLGSSTPVSATPEATTSALPDFTLDPAGNVYKINGTDYLSYYPTLEESDIKNKAQEFAFQVNTIVKRHPDVRFYAYYVTKTEDLTWFNESEGISVFDYSAYIDSLLSDKIKYDKLDIETFEDLQTYLFKTDHHWTPIGGHQGYLDIWAMMRDDFGLSPAKVPVATVDFGKSIQWYGSKYNKSGGGITVSPDSFKIYKYDLGAYKSYMGGKEKDIGLEAQYHSGVYSRDINYQHYRYYYGNEEGLLKFEFPGNTYNCLMIGDSNNRPVRKLLASHFSNFYYIDKTILNQYAIDKFILDNDIDAVVILGQLDMYYNWRFQNIPVK